MCSSRTRERPSNSQTSVWPPRQKPLRITGAAQHFTCRQVSSTKRPTRSCRPQSTCFASLLSTLLPQTQPLTFSSFPTLECLEHTSNRSSYYCAPNDVWSLGVILVNLTCGRNPWKQASFEDSTYRAYTRNPEFLKTILPVSDELNDILGRIFTRDPAMRITMPELMEAIRACPQFTYQAGLAPPSPPATPPAKEPPYATESGINTSGVSGYEPADAGPPSPASSCSSTSDMSLSRQSSGCTSLSCDSEDGVDPSERPDLPMEDAVPRPPNISTVPIHVEPQRILEYASHHILSQPCLPQIIPQPTHTRAPMAIPAQPPNNCGQPVFQMFPIQFWNTFKLHVPILGQTVFNHYQAAPLHSQFGFPVTGY